MRFSIVIPSYNRASFLSNTIKSIYAQSYKDFEVILVDDGSTDDTSETIKTWTNQENFNYYYKENGERGAARNYGWEKATGEYIVFFDSDDLMKEDYLETLSIAIDNHKDFKIFASKFNFLRNGQYQVHSDLENLQEGAYGRELIIKGNSLACHFCVKNTKEIKRFEEDRRYSIMEDWMFLVQNLGKHQLYLIDKTCVTMVDHDDRSMRSDNSLIIERRMLALEYLLEKEAFTKEEQASIEAWSYYFCAVHYRIDGNYTLAKNYAKKARKYIGWNWLTLKLHLRILLHR